MTSSATDVSINLRLGVDPDGRKLAAAQNGLVIPAANRSAHGGPLAGSSGNPQGYFAPASATSFRVAPLDMARSLRRRPTTMPSSGRAAPSSPWK
ncbi:MAG: hypothetical protein U5N27_00875 [Rhizobium sp.]|nr:hypothetical protein [Rhizobium sp.]